MYAFAVSGTNLFAGTRGGAWRRPLSDMVTSVERLSTDLPTHTSLEQNYPNPFNPAITITFALPGQSFVSLKLLDARGRDVETLPEEELSAGTYSKSWDASGEWSIFLPPVGWIVRGNKKTPVAQARGGYLQPSELIEKVREVHRVARQKLEGLPSCPAHRRRTSSPENRDRSQGCALRVFGESFSRGPHFH